MNTVPASDTSSIEDDTTVEPTTAGPRLTAADRTTTARADERPARTGVDAAGSAEWIGRPPAVDPGGPDR